jgi:hypothetical protein
LKNQTAGGENVEQAVSLFFHCRKLSGGGSKQANSLFYLHFKFSTA